jgi:hypothetical protein
MYPIMFLMKFFHLINDTADMSFIFHNSEISC